MNKKSTFIEWIVCIITVTLVIYFKIDTSNKLLDKFLIDENSTILMMNNLSKLMVVIEFIASWIFTAILFHSLIIIINIDITHSFARLFRITGMGFIFLLIALLINNVEVNEYVIEYDVIDVVLLENFRNSHFLKMCNIRNIISYFFLLFWTGLYIKFTYKVKWNQTLLLIILTGLVLTCIYFIKSMVI